MKKREKSSLQHSGMPLKVTPNTGHVRAVAAPWLETFSIRPWDGVAEKSASSRLGQVFGNLTNPEEDLPLVRDEDALPSAAIGLQPDDSISQKGTGMKESFSQQVETAALPSSFASSKGLRHQPQDSSETSVTAAQDRWGAKNGMVRSAGVGKQDQVASAGSPEQRGARMAATEPKASAGRNRAPQIVVKKTIEITTLATMQTMPRPRPDHAAARFPERLLRRPLGGQTVAGVVTPGPFTPVLRGTTQPGATSSHSSDAGGIYAGLADSLSMDGPVEPRWPQSSSAALSGQSDILQRLNQQSLPEATRPSPKRVHIGNLHITVQRPAANSGVQAAPSQTPAPAAQPAASSQVFMNPWDRMYTVFD